MSRLELEILIGIVLVALTSVSIKRIGPEMDLYAEHDRLVRRQIVGIWSSFALWVVGVLLAVFSIFII